MKYCPVCQSEYTDNIERCADCEASLIEEHQMREILAQKDRDAKTVFVRAAGVENQFEADFLKDALEKENIPVMVRSFHDTAYNGIYIPQKGWGIILVPRELKEKAERIILSLKDNIK